MERCIHNYLYLYNYVFAHQILIPLQLGFVQEDSTIYQLLHTNHIFCNTVENSKVVQKVHCDISKAIDRDLEFLSGFQTIYQGVDTGLL